MSTDHEGYIIEFTQQGRAIKVTAFDPRTLTEACVVGAKGATKQQLAELAIRKLHYVLEKKKPSE